MTPVLPSRSAGGLPYPIDCHSLYLLQCPPSWLARAARAPRQSGEELLSSLPQIFAPGAFFLDPVQNLLGKVQPPAALDPEGPS